ncbi:male-specific lethal 2 isoform X2 [Lycorma delicatula]|uniref:male-specific lethal 2 isoform X2 n=1 Tax=Lycorma delicatula TaxID=130591 RepID=UPI003F50D6D6
MNATSLYVSTSRLVFQADLEDSASWSDLYRLIPYLRQSLSCTVCGNLLIEPYTPTETNCQHHVCRSCKGGKKKLKPSCSWCKDYDKYVENVQLRILLQCYKKLCEYVANSSIYRRLIGCSTTTAVGGSSLIDLIHEGSGFKDEFKSSNEQKTSFSVVPSVYTSTSTQTSAVAVSGGLVVGDYSMQINNKDDQMSEVNNIQTVVDNNGLENNIDNSTIYSVMYGACGSKLTLKRTGAELKSEEHQIEMENIPIIEVSEKTVQTALRLQTARRRARSNVKKLPHNSVKGSGGGGGSSGTVKTGCRCGNATATPGKLTCCGQRCPCYIDSKACLECKCRGCRNPHTSDGHKICINPYEGSFEKWCSTGEVKLNDNGLVCWCFVLLKFFPHLMFTNVVGMYTTQLHNVSTSSSATSIILDGNSVVTTDHDSNDLGLEI